MFLWAACQHMCLTVVGDLPEAQPVLVSGPQEHCWGSQHCLPQAALGPAGALHPPRVTCLHSFSAMPHMLYDMALHLIKRECAALQSGAIGPLTQLLWGGSDDAKEASARAFWNMGTYNSQNKVAIANAGAVPALVQLLSYGTHGGGRGSPPLLASASMASLGLAPAGQLPVSLHGSACDGAAWPHKELVCLLWSCWPRPVAGAASLSLWQFPGWIGCSASCICGVLQASL